jgi:Family of unknown function (DUF5994)
MSATTEFLPSPREGTDDLPARLGLKDLAAPRGLLDGAWWPRSRDLSRELPALAEALDPLRDRVTRAAVNHRYWPVVPRKVALPGRVLKVGWFGDELDAHKILLLSYRIGRWDLLVVPPETAPDSAAWLMAEASSAAGPLRTASMLVEEEARRGPSAAHLPSPAERWPEDLPRETWEDEGGATAAAPWLSPRATAAT